MKQIAIVHYLPLEFYPPVTNLLDMMAHEQELQTKVWTCHNHKKRPTYIPKLGVSVSRAIFPNPSDLKILRFLKYLLFNIRCFFGLLIFKPDTILYYESYSVGPVYWYLKFFGTTTELLIHNHEYFDPKWYERGMDVVRYYHKQEKSFLFEKAQWISQTNTERVKLFVKDHGAHLTPKMRVIPNYPPRSWTPSARVTSKSILKTVYVGSLSMTTTYLEAYCNWIIAQKGKVLFDIYAYNVDAITKAYLNAISSPYITFNDTGVGYHDIPKLLSQYDVGVIFYKAYCPNFTYNAPNKLFEYVTCHLQVWYADELLGIAPYTSTQVVPIDFNKLSTFNYRNVVEQNVTASTNFTAEEALRPLLKLLKE